MPTVAGIQELSRATSEGTRNGIIVEHGGHAINQRCITRKP